MSDYSDRKINNLRLILSDYQSELNAIDAETSEEKARILNAIEKEELEIKSLLEQYRQIKRHKEIDGVRSSYQDLARFKQNLLLKIKSESQPIDSTESLQPLQPQSIRHQDIASNSKDEDNTSRELNNPPELTATPTKIQTKATKLNDEQDLATEEEEIEGETEILEYSTVNELIQFVDESSLEEIVKLYPADVSQIVENFDPSNTKVRDLVLQHYKDSDPDIYQSLLKLYQKPNLTDISDVPSSDSLKKEDLKYHEFLQANYPLSLPFFWFLINREPDSIRYAVMLFAIDHIIQTNTLTGDPHRRELSLTLSELLKMNNGASIEDFLRDLFICFHPQRISQKTNSKNKYFDYMDSIITTQSTLQYSDILLMWNYMKKYGYAVVSSPDFALSLPKTEDLDSSNQSIAIESDSQLL